MFYGRIAKQWDEIADYRSVEGYEWRPGIWSGRAIRLCWRFGMDLWKACNQLVHGPMGGISQTEKDPSTKAGPSNAARATPQGSTVNLGVGTNDRG